MCCALGHPFSMHIGSWWYKIWLLFFWNFLLQAGQVTLQDPSDNIIMVCSYNKFKRFPQKSVFGKIGQCWFTVKWPSHYESKPNLEWFFYPLEIKIQFYQHIWTVFINKNFCQILIFAKLSSSQLFAHAKAHKWCTIMWKLTW